MMLPQPNAILHGQAGILLVVQAGAETAPLARFQVFARLGGAPPAAQTAAAQALTTLPADFAAQQAVKTLYANHWGGLTGLSPQMIEARLRTDLTDGIFLAGYYIPTAGSGTFVVAQKPHTAALLADAAGTPNGWTPAQRIAAMLRRVPAHLPTALCGQVAALFSPLSIALLAIMLAALAISQAYGVGEVVDLILVAAAWVAAGWVGLVALKNFIAAVIDAAGEKSLPGIEADAAQAATALVTLGVTFLTIIFLRARAQENAVTEGDAPPEPPPPPKKPAPATKGWTDYAPSPGAKTTPATAISPKISGQMARRGWSPQAIDQTIANPTATSPATSRITGNAGTAYFGSDGSYVVRDDVTGDIVQISDKNDPNWAPDPSITNPYNPKGR